MRAAYVEFDASEIAKLKSVPRQDREKRILEELYKKENKDQKAKDLAARVATALETVTFKVLSCEMPN